MPKPVNNFDEKFFPRKKANYISVNKFCIPNQKYTSL
jgi:hypothetical protein